MVEQHFGPVWSTLLLLLMLLLVVAYGSLRWWPALREQLGLVIYWVQTLGFWLIIFLALLPLAMTMALLWKTKEVILDSVFSRKPW